jgi:hypothetical protein
MALHLVPGGTAMTDGVLTLIVLGLVAEVLLLVTAVIERLTAPRPDPTPDRSRGLLGPDAYR